MSEIERIWRFARDAYGDETAFAHPTRLAALAQSDDEIAVALLHDVIEDELAPRDAVVNVLGSEDDPRFQAVLTLSRDKVNESYERYVQRVIDSGNPLAIAVKMYDLFDHIMPGRLLNIGPSHAKTYTDALQQMALACCADTDSVRNKG